MLSAGRAVLSAGHAVLSAGHAGPLLVRVAAGAARRGGFSFDARHGARPGGVLRGARHGARPGGVLRGARHGARDRTGMGAVVGAVVGAAPGAGSHVVVVQRRRRSNGWGDWCTALGRGSRRTALSGSFSQRLRLVL